MQGRPLITVVMPVYNAMPYLPDAVRSIFAQTIDDWELIAIDDGSTDNAWAYLNRIRDERVRVYRNDENLGLAYSVNRAVALARGKYIARMDGDDLSFPSRLESQAKLMESRPELDLVGCGYIKVTSDLQVIDVRRTHEAHRELTRIVRFDKSFLHGPVFGFADGVFFGRSEWFRRWPRFKDPRYVEDFELLCRSMPESTFGSIADPLYVYRRGGSTGTWARQAFAAWGKAQCILRYCFRPGYRAHATVALASAALRPFTAAIVYAAANMSKSNGTLLAKNASTADRALLAGVLAQLAKSDVPLRTAEF